MKADGLVLQELRKWKHNVNSFSGFSDVSRVSNVSQVSDASLLVDKLTAPFSEPSAALSTPPAPSGDDVVSRSMLGLWQSFGFLGKV